MSEKKQELIKLVYQRWARSAMIRQAAVAVCALDQQRRYTSRDSNYAAAHPTVRRSSQISVIFPDSTRVALDWKNSSVKNASLTSSNPPPFLYDPLSLKRITARPDAAAEIADRTALKIFVALAH